MEDARSKSNRPSGCVVVLRWLAVLPAAVIASIVGHWLVVGINRLSMAMVGVNPDSLLASIFIFLVGSVVTGAGFVYVGTYVAPAHERAVAFVLAAIFILLAGAVLLVLLERGDLVALLQVSVAAFSAGVIAYKRSVDDTPLNEIV
jgi:hypothetical protein